VKPLQWFQPSLSRFVASYPFSFGKWRLRRLTSEILVADIGSDVFIRATGLVDAEWSCFEGIQKEDRTIHWLREFLRPGMTVVDVGANIGYISLISARIVGKGGRVLSFEPTPAVARRLRENVCLNGFQHVTVIEAAVTSVPGSLRFYESDEDPEANTLFSNGPGAFLTVQGVTLDDTLQAENAGHVDLLKIDAEGAEPGVLQGAIRILSRPDRPTLLFEANSFALSAAGSNMHELLALVRSFGYTCRELERFQWKGDAVINYVATPDKQ
jgi:FkbM family methyltransferase